MPERAKVIGDSILGLTVTVSAATGTASAFGWMDFVNQYAGALSFLSALFFGLIGVGFHIYDRFKKQKSVERNRYDIEQLTIDNKELRKQIKKIGTRVRSRE